LEKTDWIEALHRRYRSFQRLESSIEAARYLYLSGKYREEAIWFWCHVLTSEAVCSTDVDDWLVQTRIEMQRGQAEVLALVTMNDIVFANEDWDNYMKYVVPWLKTFRDQSNYWDFFSDFCSIPDYVESRTKGGFEWLSTNSIKPWPPEPPRPSSLMD
jgi:hypothetical protein